MRRAIHSQSPDRDGDRWRGTSEVARQPAEGGEGTSGARAGARSSPARRIAIRRVNVDRVENQRRGTEEPYRGVGTVCACVRPPQETGSDRASCDADPQRAQQPARRATIRRVIDGRVHTPCLASAVVCEDQCVSYGGRAHACGSQVCMHPLCSTGECSHRSLSGQMSFSNAARAVRGRHTVPLVHRPRRSAADACHTCPAVRLPSIIQSRRRVPCPPSASGAHLFS
ncbi:hypothetical protein DAEQUDRAFT_335243 [Daedalea quercina L-15889]|uniref:Uncharacterized protein n=1 Tax=Daedalea quercina L-15889 TaxID=1314783 RepID=A0A165PHK3_9APHY|nr:hypothetical protein DAEQUDRAFT_335243 [Daedalea quercina L-15889]